jgi:hypothetical protein
MMTVSGVSGLSTPPLYDSLSSLTGLTSFQDYAMGAVFVFYGLVVFSLGAMPELRGVGIGVLVANVAFTLASIVAAEALPLTVTGAALMLAGGAYTAGFAGLQYLGLRRLETA